mmetsp:Transcript_21448/g.51635  ORF Transcript_21448/g.51635 Transcript_21448/m.51635 type:complete len:292 (-) Transcript_21448:62-937(-)
MARPTSPCRVPDASNLRSVLNTPAKVPPMGSTSSIVCVSPPRLSVVSNACTLSVVPGARSLASRSISSTERVFPVVSLYLSIETCPATPARMTFAAADKIGASSSSVFTSCVTQIATVGWMAVCAIPRFVTLNRTTSSVNFPALGPDTVGAGWSESTWNVSVPLSRFQLAVFITNSPLVEESCPTSHALPCSVVWHAMGCAELSDVSVPVRPEIVTKALTLFLSSPCAFTIHVPVPASSPEIFPPKVSVTVSVFSAPETWVLSTVEAENLTFAVHSHVLLTLSKREWFPTW